MLKGKYYYNKLSAITGYIKLVAPFVALEPNAKDQFLRGDAIAVADAVQVSISRDVTAGSLLNTRGFNEFKLNV